MFQKIMKSDMLRRCIGLAAGILTIVALCVPLQIVTAKIDGQYDVFYDSGFTFFRFYSNFVDSEYTPWLNAALGCLYIVQLITGLTATAFAIVAFFVKVKNEQRIEYGLFIACSVFIVLYFIAGLILYLIYTNIGTEVSEGQYTEFFTDSSGRISGENISIVPLSFIPLLAEIIGVAVLYLILYIYRKNTTQAQTLGKNEGDLIENLKNIQALRKEGILTEEEFEELKREIFNRRQ